LTDIDQDEEYNEDNIISAGKDFIAVEKVFNSNHIDLKKVVDRPRMVEERFEGVRGDTEDVLSPDSNIKQEQSFHGISMIQTGDDDLQIVDF
jgi:hypothetical protein